MQPALTSLELQRDSLKLLVEASIRTHDLAAAARGLAEIKALDERIHSQQGRVILHLREQVEGLRQTDGELRQALADMTRERDELETQVAWLENDLARDAE